ncbi:hypothetical protein Zmor_004650 [Zophobas morio]|uniref:SAM domain-containing protein n=1 Tax=Zophobas morio TaxID=2755281 RepID=A0AA38IRS1_9CUCU|nr:hypothetical protein Zmor_004650 [Zophobas morio]
MNLLDTVLCTSDAQEYSHLFKQFGIDAFTLKILCDDDLKLMGIKEVEKRISILTHAANLQIPAEKHVDILIDQTYVLSVLAQTSVHLTKHLAALSIAVSRQDVIVCDVRLSPATKCLENSVKSLGTQLEEFEEKMLTKQMKRRNYKCIVVSGILIACVGLISLKVCQYVCRGIKITR